MKGTWLRMGLFLFMAAWVGFSTAWNASYASKAGEKMHSVPEEKVQKEEVVKQPSADSEVVQKVPGEKVDREQLEPSQKVKPEKEEQAVQNPPEGEETATVKKPEQEKKEKETVSSAIVYQGPQDKKRVALTFDDGPDRRYTPQVLDILKGEQVPATFFVVGKEVNQNRDVARRIVSDGHVIANHTWSHVLLSSQPDKRVQGELVRTVQAVKKATGKEMSLMRPPYGAVEGKEQQVTQTGHRIINWDVDTNDWKPGRSSQQILETVKGNVVPGSIVLMHSGGGNRSATVQALPEIIQHLKKQGYEFVTVDQLLDVPAYIN